MLDVALQSTTIMEIRRFTLHAGNLIIFPPFENFENKLLLYRYGHATVVRILISAKCDVDAFNLNHDTPLHITCAMGRRKLTKLILEADPMQFQNLQQETPLDIARRKNLTEIIEIMTNYKDKLEKKMMHEAVQDNKSQPQLLPHNSKLKYNIQKKHKSPYGCHTYPDIRNFPSPKLESLPKDPLEKGEQYYLGNY